MPTFSVETRALRAWLWDGATPFSSAGFPPFSGSSNRSSSYWFTCLSTCLLSLVICAFFAVGFLWAGRCSEIFRSPISFSNTLAFISHTFPTLSSSTWKLCLCASIASSCICLITCNSRTTSYMTFSFHSCIFSFSPWSSWLATCLMTASADLPALGVTRDSCLVLNRFAPFPLAALRIPGFTDWFLSFPAPSWRPCWAWCCASCSCPFTIAEVASHASGAPHASNVSFSMSLYPSILHPLCASALLKKTSKLPENNIELGIKARYTIKIRF